MGDVLEGLLKQLLTAVSDDIAEPLVDPQPAPVGGVVSDAYGCLLEGGPETLLALVELLLNPLALGDVVLYALPVTRTTLLISHQHSLVPEPHHTSIAGDLTILHHEGLTGRVRTPVLSQDPFTVLGMQQPDPEPGVFH